MPAPFPASLCPGCTGRGTGTHCCVCGREIPVVLRREPGAPSEIDPAGNPFGAALAAGIDRARTVTPDGPPRDYQVSFARIHRGREVPPLRMSADGLLDDDGLAARILAYLDTMPGLGFQPVTVAYRAEQSGILAGHVNGTVSRATRGRGEGAGQSAALSFSAVWGPRRGPGRPAIGGALSLRLPDHLREAVSGQAVAGERDADTYRRLLAVAVSPVLPEALTVAAAHWAGLAANQCMDCPEPAADDLLADLCPACQETQDRADAARELLAMLCPVPAADGGAA